LTGAGLGDRLEAVLLCRGCAWETCNRAAYPAAKALGVRDLVLSSQLPKSLSATQSYHPPVISPWLLRRFFFIGFHAAAAAAVAVTDRRALRVAEVNEAG
jgi:hypothetical protein